MLDKIENTLYNWLVVREKPKNNREFAKNKFLDNSYFRALSKNSQ